MTIASATKLVGIVCLFGAALTQLYVGNFEQAASLFGMAATAAGFVSTVGKLRAESKTMAADLEDIRNNPAMPGTPTEGGR